MSKRNGYEKRLRPEENGTWPCVENTKQKRKNGRKNGAGRLSVTSPAISHVGVGEDTLHVGIDVEWENAEWVFSQFKAAREEAIENDGSTRISFAQGAIVADVRASGFSAGPWHYPYRLEFEGWTAGFSPDSGEKKPATGNVRVEVGSLYLMRFGIETTWAAISETIRLLGGIILSEKISRIDLAVDAAGLDIEYWRKHLRADPPWCIARAKLKEEIDERTFMYGRRFKAYYVGNGKRILIRIYDKLNEVKRRSPEKEGVMIEGRWGGSMPEAATRVELQLRREFLAEVNGGISTIEQWLRHRSAILDYAMKEWFRITASAFDPTHTARAKTEPIWDQLRQSALKELGEIYEPVTREILEGVVDDAVLEDMIGGCISSMVARRGDVIEEREALRDAIEEKLGQVLDRKMAKIHDRYLEKAWTRRKRTGD